MNINSKHDSSEVAAALARPDSQKVTPEPVQRVGPGRLEGQNAELVAEDSWVIIFWGETKPNSLQSYSWVCRRFVSGTSFHGGETSN